MRMIVIFAEYGDRVFALETHNLAIRFAATTALSDVTMQVPFGSSVAVVGANGSGKSTLLGALARLHKPARGRVEIVDDVALVLQATEVDDALPITVLDAVKLGRYPMLGLTRRFRDIDRQAVADAVERMNIKPLLDMRLQELSGGQRQRVLLAQGLAQHGRVLLLDEPMTGLDVAARELVLGVVAQEVAAERSVLMATHSLADARECDLVLLLDTTPIAFGPPDEVLTEPNLLRTFGHRMVHVDGKLTVDDHHEH